MQLETRTSKFKKAKEGQRYAACGFLFFFFSTFLAIALNLASFMLAIVLNGRSLCMTLSFQILICVELFVIVLVMSILFRI